MLQCGAHLYTYTQCCSVVHTCTHTHNVAVWCTPIHIYTMLQCGAHLYTYTQCCSVVHTYTTWVYAYKLRKDTPSTALTKHCTHVLPSWGLSLCPYVCMSCLCRAPHLIVLLVLPLWRPLWPAWIPRCGLMGRPDDGIPGVGQVWGAQMMMMMMS